MTTFIHLAVYTKPTSKPSTSPDSVDTKANFSSFLFSLFQPNLAQILNTWIWPESSQILIFFFNNVSRKSSFILTSAMNLFPADNHNVESSALLFTFVDILYLEYSLFSSSCSQCWTAWHFRYFMICVFMSFIKTMSCPFCPYVIEHWYFDGKFPLFFSTKRPLLSVFFPPRGFNSTGEMIFLGKQSFQSH